MSNKSKLISRVISLIEEHTNQWIKAAFYSDPEVNSILEKLYDRWEKNDRRGIPLDYASIDELEILAEKATRYSSMSTSEAQRLVVMRR